MDDVFLKGVVDLFGDPVPRSRSKKGRPPHTPTADNRRFVELALACGRSEEEIAAGLRINVRTLNRHYFHELEGKRAARLRLDMKNMAAIVEQVNAGKPAAMALLDKKLRRLEQEEVASRFQRQPKEAQVGKKEAARAAAKKVEGKYAPRPLPSQLN